MGIPTGPRSRFHRTVKQPGRCLLGRLDAYDDSFAVLPRRAAGGTLRAAARGDAESDAESAL